MQEYEISSQKKILPKETHMNFLGMANLEVLNLSFTGISEGATVVSSRNLQN